MQTYPIQVFKSADIGGITGDNGETFCVFSRNTQNALLSTWKWFFTMEEAMAFANINNRRA
ncbi:MAG: hypothetical protein ACLQF0_06735 [Dissulfurispiraceae bacterium]